VSPSPASERDNWLVLVNLHSEKFGDGDQDDSTEFPFSALTQGERINADESLKEEGVYS
jgi:hypothetical protein